MKTPADRLRDLAARLPVPGPDALIVEFDRALRTLGGRPRGSGRPSPAAGTEEETMSPADRGQSVAMMRVNHAGEVAAQALYHGQAAAAREPELAAHLRHAAREEGDHLAWCRERVERLGGRTSRLDPLWYGGSYCIGFAAGLAGRRWSLGFVAETERQVVEHLEGHLDRLPAGDRPSRSVLERMRADELGHGVDARRSGGRALPRPLRGLMRRVAGVMTGVAYWV